jgi:septal ring factor EnvC (AmiA/AmiB activator)
MHQRQKHRRTAARVTRFALLLTSLLSGLAAPAHAGLSESRQELQVLRTRIDQLKHEIETAQGERDEAADSLRVSEQGISNINRELRNLARQDQQLHRELAQLARKTQLAEAEQQEQQNRLAILLRQRYLRGSNEAAYLALAGTNPADIVRQMGYAGYVAQARAELIRNHTRTIKRLQSLRQQTTASQTELAAVRDRQTHEKQALEREKSARQRVLEHISQKIQSQRQEVHTLEQDQVRLARLVERLTKLAEERARRIRAKAQQSHGEKIDRVADASLASFDFPALRGRLALPVAGRITARFDSSRPGGGPSWKGLMIEAPQGQPVRAVASGEVAFSNWLRGFGNLLIIDHGDNYLSLYSNNESLYKQPGDRVKAGDAIAAVGNTGGQENPGLYFELRHKGKPFDPLTWIAH